MRRAMFLLLFRGIGSFKYRNGPVPGTACKQASCFGGGFTYPAKYGEIRETDFADRFDPDIKKYRINVRRRRIPALSEDPWDDSAIYCRANRCWKHFRQKQYKGH